MLPGLKRLRRLADEVGTCGLTQPMTKGEKRVGDNLISIMGICNGTVPKW